MLGHNCSIDQIVQMANETVFNLPVVDTLEIVNIANKQEYQVPAAFIQNYHNQLGVYWTIHCLDGSVFKFYYLESRGRSNWGRIMFGWKDFQASLRIADGQTVTFKYLGMSRFRVDLPAPVMEEEEEKN
ncbi:hypothetical protein RIF29_10257 [Crotalaria pallida]|uniref:TF-B3 domain-containing protein n=1 Tax=Crotalaria pallida TaxID=3830 RepID=A0AAN9FV30_CROPI